MFGRKVSGGGPEGFNRFQLSRIIETLKKAGLEMEWLWIDVLAIPSDCGSADDDELKVTIINNLADIYKQADAVLILDALLLRMSPRTLTDVAVGLVCGNWITRIWTYQEVKLASRALIVTSSRTVELAAVVSELELSVSSQPLLFEQLLKSIRRLMRYDALGVSIKDIAMSCGERETGNEIDYVRAFFPVLGLKWNVRWGPEDGMKAIYSSRWMQAGSMVLLHGRKRMTSAPAWAPFQLTGLEGKIIGGMAWESRGLKGEWYCGKIPRALIFWAAETRHWIVEMNVCDPENELKTAFFQMKLAQDETDDVIRAFRTAAEAKIAWVLWQSELSPATVSPQQYRYAQHVLLVEEAQHYADTFECYAHFTAALLHAVLYEPFVDKKRQVLIRNENPRDPIAKDLAECAFHLLGNSEEHEHETPLHVAAKTGDISALDQLLEEQPALKDGTDSRGWTPLHTASVNGQYDFAVKLLAQGSAVDLPASNNKTPLYLAAENGHDELVQLFLQYGASTEPRCSRVPGFNKTMLHHAASGGHTKVVLHLLEAGAACNTRVNDDNPNSETPLHLAAKNNHAAVVSVLLLHGADTNTAIAPNCTALYVAAASGSSDIMRMLLRLAAPENINPPAAGTYTPLHAAVLSGDEATVSMLLEAGATPETPGTEKQPLHLAVEAGDVGTTRRLLDKRVDVNVRTADGWTPLALAAAKGKRPIVRMLLAAAADDVDGAALRAAEAAGHERIVEILNAHRTR